MPEENQSAAEQLQLQAQRLDMVISNPLLRHLHLVDFDPVFRLILSLRSLLSCYHSHSAHENVSPPRDGGNCDGLQLRLSRAGACQFESFAFTDEEMEEKIEGLFDSKDSEIANLSWME